MNLTRDLLICSGAALRKFAKSERFGSFDMTTHFGDFLMKNLMIERLNSQIVLSGTGVQICGQK
jgi:hypothetical protein